MKSIGFIVILVLLGGSRHALAQCGSNGTPLKVFVENKHGPQTITPPKNKRVYLEQAELYNNGKTGPEILPTTFTIGPLFDAGSGGPITLTYTHQAPAKTQTILFWTYSELIHGPVGTPITLVTPGAQGSLLLITVAGCFAD